MLDRLSDPSPLIGMDPDILEALKRLHFPPPLNAVRLTGGVSSDIWRVDLPDGPICVKRALAKLRVTADWHAPVERNIYEARWMRHAAGFAPRLLGQDESSGVLAMEFLPPEHYALWKNQLRDGQADPIFASQVAAALAAIHGRTAADPGIAKEFPTDDIFFDIRLEPYLVAAGRTHRDLAEPLSRLIETTRTNKKALVHGDVSPKNILRGPDGPVFLDAECAWWGDPAFDLAFCLNHLLLKCLWTPAARNGFLTCYDAMAETYLGAVNWESSDALEQRTAALLPGLFLARVDGKSPVEYIVSEHQRDQVRRVARHLLLTPPVRLSTIRDAWKREIEA